MNEGVEVACAASSERFEPEVLAPHAAERSFWFRTGMPRWIPRFLLLLFISIALGWWVLAQAGHLGLFIRIVVYSLFLSFALEPAVDWLEEHGWKRSLGTLLMMLAALLVGIGVLASMVPLVVSEAGKLSDQAPHWVSQIDASLERWFGVRIGSGSPYSVSELLRDRLSAWSGDVAGSLFGLTRTAVGLVFELLTVALFTFYLVAEAHRVRRRVCMLFQPRWQQAILRGWEISIKKMGGFLYSRLLLGIVIGLVTFAVLWLLRVPYAAPLALWLAFCAEFIPNIGTYIGAAAPLAVCAVERGLAPSLILLAFILIYQQFENYVLSPRISAHTMQVHPAVAFGAAIVGGSLFGIMGAFLAVPAVAILQAILSTYVHRYDLIESDLLHDHDPETPD